jgi:hypothetical protein
VDGPLFTDRDNVIMSTHALDGMLTELLEEIYDTNPRLYPMSVTSREDINGSYQVLRTFWRLSDIRVLEQHVSTYDINIVNRWRKMEQGKEGARHSK